MPFRSPIFSNPASAERAKLAGLIDLIDAVKLTLEGEVVTLDTVRERIRKLESVRQAERVIKRMAETAGELGYQAGRAPFVETQEGPDFDVRPGDRTNLWAMRFERPSELLIAAQEAVENLIGEAPESSSGARHYALLKDLGLCVGCRKVPPRPGRVHCTECAVEWRDRRERQIARGVCPKCRGPLGDSGTSTCRSCLSESRAQSKTWARQGLCSHCGQEPPVEGRKVCARCGKQESDYHARRYRDLKARGLCRCKQPLEPGRSTCVECRRKQEAAEVRRQEGRRSKGLCVKCGQPAASGFVLCQKHLDLQAKRSSEKRAAAVQSGVCRSCGERWDGPQIDCDECRAGVAERRARLEAGGLCRDCGERAPIQGRKVCQRCVDMAKSRYDRRKAAGLCVHCEDPVDHIGDATCRDCRRASADRYARARSGS